MSDNVEVVENENYVETGKPSREWTAIRDECISGGQMTDDCNLVASTQGAKVQVVMQKLICGCILVPSDYEEILL